MEVEPIERIVEVMKSIAEIEIQTDDIPIGVVVQMLVINVEGDQTPQSYGALKRSVM